MPSGTESKKIHEMRTDSEIDQFLASMRSTACRKFVQRLIIDLRSVIAGVIFGFPGLYAIAVSGQVGEIFAMSFAGRVTSHPT